MALQGKVVLLVSGAAGRIRREKGVLSSYVEANSWVISRNDFLPIEAPRTLGLNSLIMLEIDKTDLQSRSPPVKFFYKKISSTETQKLRSPAQIEIVHMKVLGYIRCY